MVRLIQLTDTHIVSQPNGTLYGVNTDNSLVRVLDHILQSRLTADAVLVTGDLVHDEGEAAYRKLASMLSRLQLPVHYLAGNHDRADILHQCLPNSPAAGVYSFILQNWLVVMLNSAVPDKVEGYLSQETLANLTSLLQSHPDHYILVAVHHHPVSTGSEWMDHIGISNGAALLAVLDLFPQVRVVINGHIHQLLQAELGHYTVFGTPSTCAQFKPGQVKAGTIDAAPPGYRFLELHDDGSYHTQVFRVA